MRSSNGPGTPGSAASWLAQGRLQSDESNSEESAAQGEHAMRGIRVNAGTTQAGRPAASRRFLAGLCCGASRDIHNGITPGEPGRRPFSNQSAAASPTARWDKLPPVLTQSVFENFHPTDFANASRVCKAWRRAGIRSLHTLHLTDRYGRIDMHRTRAAVNLLLLSGEQSPLQRLELPSWEPLWTGISQEDYDARMGRLLGQCPHLRHLSACDVEAFALVGLPHLTSLHMGHWEKHPASTFSGLSELPGLRALGVSGQLRHPVTDDDLAMLQHARQIETLSLSGNHEITDAGLMHLPEGLSTLDMEHLPRITEAGLEHLTRLRNLRVLRNPPSCWFSDLGTSRLAHLTGLQRIGPCWTLLLTDTGLAQLSSLRELHTLELGGAHLTTDAGWRTFLEAAHQLRHLSVGDCVSGESLASLPPGLLSLDMSFDAGVEDIHLTHLQRLQNLEELNLSHCAHITEEGLRQLAGLRRLKTLNLQGLDLSDSQVARLSTLMPSVRILR